MKFDRAVFQSVLPQGDSVEVWITGTVGTRTFTGLDTIRTDYLSALAARGFAPRATILTRERDDALDLDVVTLSSFVDGMIVRVVADVFDDDLVICLPFN